MDFGEDLVSVLFFEHCSSKFLQHFIDGFDGSIVEGLAFGAVLLELAPAVTDVLLLGVEHVELLFEAGLGADEVAYLLVDLAEECVGGFELVAEFLDLVFEDFYVNIELPDFLGSIFEWYSSEFLVIDRLVGLQLVSDLLDFTKHFVDVVTLHHLELDKRGHFLRKIVFEGDPIHLSHHGVDGGTEASLHRDADKQSDEESLHSKNGIIIKNIDGHTGGAP